MKKYTYIPKDYTGSLVEAEAIVNEEVVDLKHQYVCPKCKGTSIRVETKQIRSADEPATCIITCMQCGFTKRKN